MPTPRRLRRPRPTFTTALVLTLVALPTVRAANPPERPAALDGQVFHTEIALKEGKQIDEMFFSHGLLRSAFADAHGFRDAPYQAKAAGSLVTFEAISESYQEGTMSWKGQIIGDEIKGTLVWNEHEHPVESHYHGQRKH
jgi:hypothetical protein